MLRIEFRKFDSNNEFHRAQQNVRRDVQGLGLSLDFGNNYDNRFIEIEGNDAAKETAMESLRVNGFDIESAEHVAALPIAA